MIPTDLAARLRLMTESLVNPVSPVHEIPAELPELTIGQRFTARVESALPDGTFRALVAGRSLTLALPQSATPGDTLELVVTARTPRLIVAETAEALSARQSPSPTLSQAGQIISTLLAGEENAPQPPTITRLAPLLPEPQLQAARLAPALQQAIVESGLFYEAHQAQWVAGRYPAEALAREPQARYARSLRTADAVDRTQAPEAAPTGGHPSSAEPASARSAAVPASDLPAELQPLVQQQLDAAATQHVIWRGEVWPGQYLQWEIEAEQEQGSQPEEETATQWASTLNLILPQLGEVSAALRLTPAGIGIALSASAAGTGVLQAGVPDLSAALAAAGIPLLSIGIESREPAA